MSQIKQNQPKKYTGATSDFAPVSPQSAPVMNFTRAIFFLITQKIALVVISVSMREFATQAQYICFACYHCYAERKLVISAQTTQFAKL